MQLEGNWNLEVSTPFGNHPATLVFTRDGGGDALSGSIKSQLGNAPLRDIKTTDDGFEASVALELQGREYEADISGQVTDDRMDSVIKVHFALAPRVKFTGTRET